MSWALDALIVRFPSLALGICSVGGSWRRIVRSRCTWGNLRACDVVRSLMSSIVCKPMFLAYLALSTGGWFGSLSLAVMSCCAVIFFRSCRVDRLGGRRHLGACS